MAGIKDLSRAWVIAALAAAVLCAVAVRAPGVDWLIGAGPKAEFTFHADDNRFLEGARNFRKNWPDGYVVGVTAQLFVALGIVEQFGAVNGARVMRVISQLYAVLSLLLTYFVARAVGTGRLAGVLAVWFLAFAPMHVINSSFGTADMPVLALFYGLFLGAGAYLRTGKESHFIIATVLTGAVLALKFYLPALAVVGAMLLLSHDRTVFSRYLAATLFVMSGFFIFSLFNYTIWEFMPFIRSLFFDNVVIPGGHGPFMQAIKYGGDLVPAMGIALFLLFVVGGAFFMQRLWAFARLAWAADGGWGARVDALAAPGVRNVVLLAAGLSVHFVLIMIAGIHGPRHALVFVPAACILAGFAVEQLWSVRAHRALAVSAAAIVVIYSAYNAAATQSMYTHDLRHAVADWARPIAADGKRIVSLMRYSQVAGTETAADEADVRKADYFVACDIEFRRYVGVARAEDIHHGYGESRLEFYRGLFEGKESFVVERAFKQEPTSLETRLIEQRRLPPFGMTIPRTCLAFRRVAAPPGVPDRRVIDATDPSRNSW